MSPVSPISSFAGGQTAFWATNLADQLTQDLQMLSSALQSGDATGATRALATLRNLLQTSDPASALVSKSTLLADITWMSQALESQDSTMINSAFAALQKDLGTLVVSVLSGTRQLQTAAAFKNQDLNSGDSITISSASATSQLVDGVPASANTVASLAYVVNNSGGLPENLANPGSTAIKPDLDLLSAQLAREAAKIATPVNELQINSLGSHGTTYLAIAIFVAIAALLLFCIL